MAPGHLSREPGYRMKGAQGSREMERFHGSPGDPGAPTPQAELIHPAGGRAVEGSGFSGDRISAWGNEKVLERDGSNARITL